MYLKVPQVRPLMCLNCICIVFVFEGLSSLSSFMPLILQQCFAAAAAATGQCRTGALASHSNKNTTLQWTNTSQTQLQVHQCTAIMLCCCCCYWSMPHWCPFLLNHFLLKNHHQLQQDDDKDDNDNYDDGDIAAGQCRTAALASRSIISSALA